MRKVADNIKDTVADFSNFTESQVRKARSNADALSKKALWSEFIKYYFDAYAIALGKAEERKHKLESSQKENIHNV